MNINLPPPIAAFFQAFNAQDVDACIALFAGDALVADEGHEHRGTPAIKEWIQKVNAEYKPNTEVTNLAYGGNEIVVTAQVSGTFRGSPIQIRYHFRLKDDKITVLVSGDYMDVRNSQIIAMPPNIACTRTSAAG